jgi:hypothetical protein
MDTLFGGANHVEKGGDLLQVEDAHHAHIGDRNDSPTVMEQHTTPEIKV